MTATENFPRITPALSSQKNPRLSRAILKNLMGNFENEEKESEDNSLTSGFAKKRSFFQLAALIANPDQSSSPDNIAKIFKQDEESSENRSEFLEESYQQKSFEKKFSLHENKKIILPQKQFQSEKNISAKTFHQQIFGARYEKNFSALILSFAKKKSIENCLIESFEVFYAHRLRKKSMQTKAGADRLLKYFHLRFFAVSKKAPINLLYWLKFDDEKNITTGQFIVAKNNLGILSEPKDVRLICG